MEGAGGKSAVVLGFGLVEFGELRLGIKSVHVAGSTFHEEHDDGFGLRFTTGGFGSQGSGLLCEEIGHGDGADGGTEAIHEFAT